MKIAGYQLDNVLQKDLKPIYLISGDDPFLSQEALNSIEQYAVKQGFLDKAKWLAHDDPDEALAGLLFSKDLFHNKQFIVINFADKFPLNMQQTILHDICKHPDPDKLIVIRLKKLDEKIQKTAWFSALNKVGIIATIWPPNHEQLKYFIVARAKKYQLVIEKEVINLLADKCEGNILSAAQTLEKISLLNETRVTQEMVNELTDNNNLFTIFDLSDALLAKNDKRMLHILANLQAFNEEPTLILWSLTREVRMLIDCLLQNNEGKELQPVFNKYRILTKKQELIRRYLKEHTLALCYQWLKHAFYIDQKIKNYLITDVWRELQIFCLRARN